LVTTGFAIADPDFAAELGAGFSKIFNVGALVLSAGLVDCAAAEAGFAFGLICTGAAFTWLPSGPDVVDEVVDEVVDAIGADDWA
jgi:hypothetical protein